MSMCRQIAGTTGKVDEHFIGSKGRASMSSDKPGAITGANAWTFERKEKPVSPYVQEHTDLIASLRSGKPYNELKQVAESTLTAIMGREAAYTGLDVTWDAILNADQDLTPPQLAFGPLPVPPIPMPGVTKLASNAGPKAVQLAPERIRQSDKRFWTATQVIPTNLSTDHEPGWDLKPTCSHPHQVVGFGADDIFTRDFRRGALERDPVNAEFRGFEYAIGRHQTITSSIR
jgi:hypothetical protein